MIGEMGLGMGGVSATTETFCTQKSESARRPETESVKHRQINALKATKSHASPFFVVTAQRSQQLWHCSRISRSQFASFIWDPLLVESARPITTEGFWLCKTAVFIPFDTLPPFFFLKSELTHFWAELLKPHHVWIWPLSKRCALCEAQPQSPSGHAWGLIYQTDLINAVW